MLAVVAALLGVDAGKLERSICFRNITTGTGNRAEKFNKPLPATQAEFSRDTLSKALYSRLFDWIVKKVNESIKIADHKGCQIGVLDIYGFEIFENNSFEQLCINFVNERFDWLFLSPLPLFLPLLEYLSSSIACLLFQSPADFH